MRMEAAIGRASSAWDAVHGNTETFFLLPRRCLGLLPCLADQSVTLPAIHSQAEFDSLARVTETPISLTHVMFLIDRSTGKLDLLLFQLKTLSAAHKSDSLPIAPISRQW